MAFNTVIPLLHTSSTQNSSEEGGEGIRVVYVWLVPSAVEIHRQEDDRKFTATVVPHKHIDYFVKTCCVYQGWEFTLSLLSLFTKRATKAKERRANVVF